MKGRWTKCSKRQLVDMMVMKIIMKTITNHLKPVLLEVIDEEQSAFVKGKLIRDNALIVMECFHQMKKKKGKRGVMALKLDMSKAYDRLECVEL